jgi:hypothetical protein
MMHSIALRSQGGNSILMAVYPRMVAKVVLISVSRPLLWRSLPFQAVSFPAILSAIGCSEERGSLNTDKGMPRYVIGKLAHWH